MTTNPLQELMSSNRRTAGRLVAVVAGSGQVARCAVDAGADFLLVLNAGAYRSLGAGSLASFLAYGNANDQTERLLREHILPSCGTLPIVAGVFASDPTRPLADRLRVLRELGVAGITNWPAVGFVDGEFRRLMEADGVGVAAEVEMLRTAAEFGFATLGFALDTEAARAFSAAHVDGLVLNLGLTREIKDVHERRDQLQQALVQLRAMQAAAHEAGGRPFTLAFGGPATTPDDLEEILRHSDVSGYAGGSVFERLPVREGVTATISHFKSAATRPSAATTKEATLGDMIGSSPAMRRVFDLIKRVAPRDVNIVIQGESGTGKELVATLLHKLSPRGTRAFVTLNCGAITESLLESELFGHEKGAFTGAHRRRLGKFELAHRGTLFLDEIADLSPHAQVSLLRALQQREITRVGGEGSIPVDVRIVAASHQDLAERVAAGSFRADLYYRLNGLTMIIPPLRERPADLPLLAETTLRRLCVQWNLPSRRISAGFLDRMSRHAWPGNVRELQHIIGQALLLEDSRVLDGAHFHPSLSGEQRSISPPAEHKSVSRRASAEKALRAAHGNKSAAAASLGVTRKTFYAWLKA
jgi:DNA-binding NtrC family response regulator/predicted TIM-barrel enzyme